MVKSAKPPPRPLQQCQVSSLWIGCLRPNALHLSPAPQHTPHPLFRRLSPSAWLPDCLLSCESSTLPLVLHSLVAVTCADSAPIPLLDSVQCSPAHVFRFGWLCVNAAICDATFPGFFDAKSKRLSNYSCCLNSTTPSSLFIHGSLSGSSTTTESCSQVFPAVSKIWADNRMSP